MALASAIGFAEMASSSMSDMVLCFLELTAVILILLGVHGEHKRSLLFLGALVASSLGFLTKGILAPVFLGATTLIFLAAYRKLSIIKLKCVPIGLCLAVLIILPWHIALVMSCGWHAIDWMYFHEVLSRFSGTVGQYNFGHPFYYMAWSLVSSLLPWSLLLPSPALSLPREVKRNPKSISSQCSVFLAIFIAIQLITFSMSHSTWGYYNLPTYPAVCLLIGASLPVVLAKRRPLWHKFMLALPTIVFAVISTISIFASLVVWPKKNAIEAQYVFSQALSNCPANAQLISHADLMGQYLLSDMLIFKTGKNIFYYEEGNIAKAVNQPIPNRFCIPKVRFDELPATTRQKLKILAEAKLKFIPFPNCRLHPDNGSSNIATLILCASN